MHPANPVNPYGCDLREPGIHHSGQCIPTVRNRIDARHRVATAAKPALSVALSLFQAYPSTRTAVKSRQSGSRRASQSSSLNRKEISTIRHASLPIAPQRRPHAAEHHAWEDVVSGIATPIASDEEFLTVEEAAELFRTTTRFPRRLIAQRRIRFVKCGRYVRIPKSAAIEFLAAGLVEPLTASTVWEAA